MRQDHSSSLESRWSLASWEPIPAELPFKILAARRVPQRILQISKLNDTHNGTQVAKSTIPSCQWVGGHGSGWQWVKLVTRKLHSRARRPYKPSTWSSSPLSSTAWECLYPREIRTWMSSDAFSTSLIPSMVCPVQLITWILRRDLSLILISNGVLATQFANIHIGFILEWTRRKLWSILR